MPNIIVSTSCNLNCSYCFAKSSFKDLNTFISISDYQEIIDFIAASDENYIGLIGGEPLLHPNLHELIKRACEERDPSYVTIFTNNLLTNRYIELLKEFPVRLMINCNDVEINSEDCIKRFEANLDLLNQEMNFNKQITLSYNIYFAEQNHTRFLSYLRKYKVEGIRLAIACPCDELKNSSSLEYFQQLKEPFLLLLKELNEMKVRVTMDCNILPNCLQSEWIESLDIAPIKPMPKSVCSPIIDIFPDKTVARCFGLADFRVKLEKFRSFQQIRSFFYNHYDSQAYQICSDEKCNDCFERQCMGCMGGCLSFKQKQNYSVKCL